MALSRFPSLTAVLAAASVVVATPALAQRSGYTSSMLAELLRNGVADEKVVAMVNSGCLARPLSSAEVTDLRSSGGSADLVMKIGRACLVGGEAGATPVATPVATPAPTPAPAPAAVPVAAPAAVPVAVPVAAPVAAPAAVPVAAEPTARQALPPAATLDVAGLGAVKAAADFFECPALSATPDRYLGPSSARFDSRVTRYICARMKFVSAQPASATPALKLQCKYDKDGGTLAVGEIDGTPSAGASAWEAYIQFGKDDYDSWKTGQYNLFCDYGAATVIRAPFSVFTSGIIGDDIPSLKAKVLALRTFPTGPEIVPLMQRAYTDVFMSDRLRMVGMELQLLFPPPDGTTSETLSCVWKSVDTGKLMYTDALVVAPKPESSTSIKATANGFTDAGGWTSGQYTVDCSLADKVIASTKFTVK